MGVSGKNRKQNQGQVEDPVEESLEVTVTVLGVVTSPVVRKGEVREVVLSDRVQEMASRGFLEMLSLHDPREVARGHSEPASTPSGGAEEWGAGQESPEEAQEQGKDGR